MERRCTRAESHAPTEAQERKLAREVAELRRHVEQQSEKQFGRLWLSMPPRVRRLVLADVGDAARLSEHTKGFLFSNHALVPPRYELGAPTKGGFQRESAGGYFHQPESRLLSDPRLRRSEATIYCSEAAQRDAARARRGSASNVRGAGHAFVSGISPPLGSRGWSRKLQDRGAVLLARSDPSKQDLTEKYLSGAFALLGVSCIEENVGGGRSFVVRGGDGAVRERLLIRPVPVGGRMHFMTTESGMSAGVPLTTTDQSSAYLSGNPLAVDLKNVMGRCHHLAFSCSRRTQSIEPHRLRLLVMLAAMNALRLEGAGTVTTCVDRAQGGGLDAAHAARLALGPKFIRAFPTTALQQNRFSLLFTADALLHTKGACVPGLMFRPVPDERQLVEMVVGCMLEDERGVTHLSLRSMHPTT